MNDINRATWTILHGGALGDLVLTIQLALRLPSVARNGTLDVISRVDPGDLSQCRPAIRRTSAETLPLHWLFGDHDEAPPESLRERLHGARVVSALGGPHTIVHQRLRELRPAALYSVDPQARSGMQRHITEQWRTQLEDQGLLVPKCIHQKPEHRTLGVPPAWRGTEADAPRPVLLHPGSGGTAKCWPLACFVDVARQLVADGQRVCFLIGPVEAESWNERQRAMLTEFALAHMPAADHLVALLAGARVLLGNDAGPSHLAALLGTPTVTLFGPTSPQVWRPLGVACRVLQGTPHRADWGLRVADVAELIRQLA